MSIDKETREGLACPFEGDGIVADEEGDFLNHLRNMRQSDVRDVCRPLGRFWKCKSCSGMIVQAPDTITVEFSAYSLLDVKKVGRVWFE